MMEKDIIQNMPDGEFVKLAKKLIKENPEIFEALLEFERTGKVPKFKKKTNI